MDPSLRHLRGVLVRRALVALGAVAATVAAVTLAVLRVRGGPSGVEGLAVALLVGQAAAAAVAAAALQSGPVTHRYLRHYLGTPIEFHPVARPEEPPAAAIPLAANGLGHRVSVSDGVQVVSLFQDVHGLVLAAVNHRSGAVSLLSRTDDGRILLTDQAAAPPTALVTVTVSAERSVEGLLASHRRALVAAGARLVPVRPDLWQHVMRVEQLAYLDLGPVVGALADPAHPSLLPSWLRVGLPRRRGARRLGAVAGFGAPGTTA